MFMGLTCPHDQELIATGRDEDEIRREIGADYLVYQDLDALIKDVSRLNPSSPIMKRPVSMAITSPAMSRRSTWPFWRRSVMAAVSSSRAAIQYPTGFESGAAE